MLRRRRFLHAALASGGALLGVEGALTASIARTPSTGASVRLGYVGNPCEAATFVAPTSAVFARHELAARLVPFRDEGALVAALGAGTLDAASVNLPALLKPLEAGCDVRVVAGLHAGCLRVVAPDDVIVRTFGNLKGTTIATDRLHGSSMNLLSALLRRQGVDPVHDVGWRVYPPEDLEAALAAKKVDCVAASDPLAYYLLADKKAEPYLNTADGGFSCGEGIGGGHHCFLALSGRLVARRPALAASLTRAYLETSLALGRGAGAAALAQVRGEYTPVDLNSTIGMLLSYDWSASTDFVLEELELTASYFRRARLLEQSTDPERFAERAYADVLHA